MYLPLQVTYGVVKGTVSNAEDVIGNNVHFGTRTEDFVIIKCTVYSNDEMKMLILYLLNSKLL